MLGSAVPGNALTLDDLIFARRILSRIAARKDPPPVDRIVTTSDDDTWVLTLVELSKSSPHGSAS